MAREGAVEIGDALLRPCIADTSVLSPLVQTGSAHLLNKLLARPIHLGPVVLDPEEIALPQFPQLTEEPSSELLRPLHVYGKHYERYRPRVPHISAFAQASGLHWNPVSPTHSELRRAAWLSSKAARDHIKAAHPAARFSAPLDEGEAEALAIAASREWTILVDDQAAVTAAQCLYPHVAIVRLCALLVHAVNRGAISCENASLLYQDDIRRGLGVFSKLRIDCDPPRCVRER